MSYNPSRRDYIFVVVSAFSLIMGLTLGLEAGEWVIRKLSYWVLLLSSGAFLYSLYRLASTQRTKLLNTVRSLAEGWSGLFLLSAMVAIFILQPGSYKVVMDEPLLVASSRQMHLEKELYVPKSCYELGGAYYNFDGYVDKRPGFFPYLLSLLHSFTGYRSTQGFVLNALLVPAFILLIAWISDRLWPGFGRFFGPLLALTVPLYAVLANSSGYDFLNLVLLLAILLLALEFYKNPGTWAMNALLWAAVLAAHTRYESVLYLIPVVLIVFIRFIQTERSFTNWITCLVPIALVPVVLLFRVIGQQEDPLQLREGDVSAFSFDHLWTNLLSAAEFFFHFGDEHPNSWLISILFVASFLAWLIVALRRLQSGRKLNKTTAWPVYALMGAGLLAFICTILFYHWGQLNDFAATRLALPIVTAALLTVVAIGGCVVTGKWQKRSLALLCVGYFAVVTVPASLGTDYLDGYPPARWSHWLKDKALKYKDDNVLFITQQRLIPMVEEVSAITVGKALGAKEKIALHHQIGTFSSILFVQLLVANETGSVVEAIPLGDHFDLKELDKHSIGAGQIVVLSELEVVHLTESEKERMDLNALADLDLSMDWFKIIPATLP